MSKEPGPREKALREMREDKVAHAKRVLAHQENIQQDLKNKVAEAAKKHGKPRKAKKKWKKK